MQTLQSSPNLPYNQSMKKVVVVLPVLNEEKVLEKTVNEVLGQQKNLPNYNIEVLIAVDEITTDKTEEEARKLAAKNKKIHVKVFGHGLGVALIEGHQYSIEHFHPDILVQIDADGQVEPEILPKLVAAIEEGYDLALGSRFIPGGKNKLSPSRRLFSLGLSVFSRIVMGPFDVGEFANSARAFTPALFKKINLERLPWREKTFIIQPSFLNEAILAGAKYKEIPLVFKNRAEGYSKNKIFNYTYDVITYTLDARLHKWGINFPLFRLSRKAKTVVKFGLVGFIGTLVDFLFYKLFINIGGFPPATAKGFSTEIAIVNNFLLNNFWTFKYRKTKTSFWQKFGIFNLVSLGGLIIGVLIVKFLHTTYGDGFILVGTRKVAYNNFYFFATIPFVMTWNFLMNHFITWRREKD